MPHLLAAPEWLNRIADLLGADADVLIGYALRVLAVWLLAWAALQVVSVIASRIEKAVDDKNELITTSKEKRGRTISQLVRGVGRVIVVAGAILLTVDVFMNIGPILGGAAILGLAVSFGAQSLVKDVITGFFMLMEDQFAVGDVIEVAGLGGSVEEITLRVVKLRDLEGNLHIIPNGEIKAVTNRTRGWSRAVVDIAVAYDSDVDQVLTVVADETRRFADEDRWAVLLDGPPEVTGVESLGENKVVVRALLRTSPGQQWAVAREFRRRIKIRMDAEGIEIPLPRRIVQVHGDERSGAAAGGAG
ncbi:MAG TPA: mechanosensitive ion channel family protein [Gemmatimonadales bacterium]|nr:mechanosensitive ion channel family protein [Gemmatimonadales bacterium]